MAADLIAAPQKARRGLLDLPTRTPLLGMAP
jgi:hypothetical protein